MTVLVTGGAGYIGSHTVYDLLSAGERVVVLDDLSTGSITGLPNNDLLILGNAGDQKLIESIVKSQNIDAIIHFAGSIVVPESLRDPLRYYRNNTMTSRALIESAVENGVKHFIFSSTAAVYGNPIRTPINEADPVAPVSPYGWSKLMTEIMLRDASAAHDFNHVTLRYFNVAGADPDQRTGQYAMNATHLIKVAVQASLGFREYVEIFGTDYSTPDGTCIRDYIHVSDLARAHRAALWHLRSGGSSTTLNCGYGQGYSVLEVIEAVKRVSGAQFAVRAGARRPGDAVEVVAEARQIRDLLQWTPEFDDLDTIVSHAVAWERVVFQNRKQ